MNYAYKNVLKNNIIMQHKAKKTADNYVKRVENIAIGIGLENQQNLLFIKKYKNKIKNFILKEPRITGQQEYVTGINGVIRYGGEQFDADTIAFFKNFAYDLKQGGTDFRLKQQKTEKEKGQWNDGEDWDVIIKKMDEQYPYFLTLNPSNVEERKSLIDYIILALYIYIPPRRLQDYSLMKIVDDEENTKDTNYNYYVKNKHIFIFNVYKTSKTYGSFTEKVPKKLYRLLHNYLLINKSGYMIISSSGRVLETPNTLGKKLKHASLNILHQDLTLNPFRHMCIEHYDDNNNQTLYERNKFAQQMGHNVMTNILYKKFD